MEQSLWEVNSCSAGQEIPQILLNQTIHYHVLTGLAPAPALTQINQVLILSLRYF